MLVHFNFQREENLSVKDTMAGSKRVHYLEVPLCNLPSNEEDVLLFLCLL